MLNIFFCCTEVFQVELKLKQNLQSHPSLLLILNKNFHLPTCWTLEAWI